MEVFQESIPLASKLYVLLMLSPKRRKYLINRWIWVFFFYFIRIHCDLFCFSSVGLVRCILLNMEILHSCKYLIILPVRYCIFKSLFGAFGPWTGWEMYLCYATPFLRCFPKRTGPLFSRLVRQARDTAKNLV